MGKFTEKDLVEILNKYGTLSNNGEETILDKMLTSIDKKHEIKVSEIWDVPFKKEMAKCTITCVGNDDKIEAEFEIGTKWDENFYKSFDVGKWLVYQAEYRRARRF